MIRKPHAATAIAPLPQLELKFQNEIPSVENIARVIYRLLKPKLQSDRTKLASVTVWETSKTSSEYSEE